MGMIQGGCRAPLNELCLGFERVCGHELDGRVGDAFGTVFREEYRAVVGATQKAPQGVGAVDDLVFPAHPDFGLGDSSRVCTHERQLAPKVVTKISPRASLHVYNIHTVSEPRDRMSRARLCCPDGVDMVMPIDTRTMSIELSKPIAMEEGQRLAIREGNETVGAGRVRQIMTQKTA